MRIRWTTRIAMAVGMITLIAGVAAGAGSAGTGSAGTAQAGAHAARSHAATYVAGR
jgi:hypothetical protein